ncbi:MAG: tRNA lysidine(34) synthetase TilS [Methylocella sp.]
METPLDEEGDSPERAAFSPEAIGRLFQPWEGARKILLAVSGGPDSIALMLLAAQWSKTRPGAPPLHVATVDHALRPQSRAEAEQVGLWAHRLGLSHDILVWSGDKPRSRIQERARAARYDLLFAHAAHVGADVVATAHHADDQAETILFRLLRGSGPGGLSGMAASRARLGLVHARPLLQCSKAELIACCAAKAHPFFTDPSNCDPAYARTRMRALSGLLEKEGLGREALLRLGRRAARAEAALAARAGAVAAGLAAAREPGLYRADISSLAREPEEIFLRVLAREIVPLADSLADAPCAKSRPLRLKRLETLAGAMQGALAASAPFSGTLGGAALKLGRDHVLTIRTEKLRRRGVTAQRVKLCDR